MVAEKGQGSGAGSQGGCGCGAGGRGPKGTCVCAACGHQIPHKPGVPCRQEKCPQCGGTMNRRD
jgi:hypothetical protein